MLVNLITTPTPAPNRVLNPMTPATTKIHSTTREGRPLPCDADMCIRIRLCKRLGRHGLPSVEGYWGPHQVAWPHFQPMMFLRQIAKLKPIHKSLGYTCVRCLQPRNHCRSWVLWPGLVKCSQRATFVLEACVLRLKPQQGTTRLPNICVSTLTCFLFNSDIIAKCILAKTLRYVYSYANYSRTGLGCPDPCKIYFLQSNSANG